MCRDLVDAYVKMTWRDSYHGYLITQDPLRLKKDGMRHPRDYRMSNKLHYRSMKDDMDRELRTQCIQVIKSLIGDG